jgi:septum formation protein
MHHLVLASASPRRRELLERIGVQIDVRPADIDESIHAGEDPIAYAARLADEKARVVRDAAPDSDACVLAADTVVALDGEVLGKAADAAEARGMLRKLAGRTHRVTTAFVLVGPAGAHRQQVSTDVTMVEMSDAQIDDYVESGEWRDKAGSYAVQGIAAALVSKVHGSVTNVIGLPLAEVALVLARSATPPRLAAGRSA